MRHQGLLGIGIAVLTCGLLLGADKAADADRDKLQGEWVVVSGQENGKEVPAEKVKGMKMTVNQDRITVDEGKGKRVMNYKLDATQTPKAIDMTTVEGSDKGKMSQGIYELDGDKLKICFAMPDKERPKNFSPKENSQEMLFIMKRASK